MEIDYMMIADFLDENFEAFQNFVRSRETGDIDAEQRASEIIDAVRDAA